MLRSRILLQLREGGEMTELTKVPGVAERVETGPLQFGDDWPGVFIRGDNALAFSVGLAGLERHMPEHMWVERALLKGLLDTLRSCDVHNFLEQKD